MAVALQGNNPGGIINTPWAQRQPGYTGPNGMYAAFRTLGDGIRAQIALLRSYIRRGFDTPAEIANRWAPSGVHGNNSSVYAQNIARQMNISVNDRITESNLNAFQNAQAHAENSQYSVNMRNVGVGGSSNVDPAPYGYDIWGNPVLGMRNSNGQYFNFSDGMEAGRSLLSLETLGRGILIVLGVLLVVIAIWAFLKGDTNINLTKGVSNV